MHNRTATTANLGLYALVGLAVAWLLLLGQHYFELGSAAIARPPSSDFYKFYLSAQRWDADQSMYWMVPPRLKKGDPCHPDTPETEARFPALAESSMTLGGDIPCLAPNLNPPIFMAVMLPLSSLSYAHAWWIWAGISAICVVLGAWLLCGELIGGHRQRTAWALITCAALFTYYPTIANFSMGQLGVALLPLLLLCWKDLNGHRQSRAGIWLGIAIAIKPFLGVLLVSTVALRLWRTFRSCIVTIVALTLIGGILFGSQSYEDYMRVAQNVGWTASNWNGSWTGLVDRAFSGQAHSNWPTTKPLAHILASACSLLTLGLVLICQSLLARRESRQGIDALFCLGIPASLLISPLGWVYYFPALMFSSAIAWSYTTQHQHKRALRLGLLIPVAMATVPISLKIVPTPLHPTTWWGVDSWYCYTLLATLFLCSITMTIGQKKKGAEAPSL